MAGQQGRRRKHAAAATRILAAGLATAATFAGVAALAMRDAASAPEVAPPTTAPTTPATAPVQIVYRYVPVYVPAGGWCR